MSEYVNPLDTIATGPSVSIAFAAIASGQLPPIWDGSSADFQRIQGAFDWAAANLTDLVIPIVSGTDENNPMKITGTINWQYAYHSVFVNRRAFIQWQQTDGSPAVRVAYASSSPDISIRRSLVNTCWDGGIILGRNDASAPITVNIISQPSVGDVLVVGYTTYRFVASNNSSTTSSKGQSSVITVPIGSSTTATASAIVSVSSGNTYATVVSSGPVLTIYQRGSQSPYLTTAYSNSLVAFSFSRGSCCALNGFDIGQRPTDTDNYNGAGVSFRNIGTAYVGDVFTLYSNTYLITWDKISSRFVNRVFRQSDVNSLNSGENFIVRGCVFTSCNGVLDCSNSEWNITQTSFDYNRHYAIRAFGSANVKLIGCHVEDNSDSDYILQSFNSSTISHVNTSTYVSISGAKAWEWAWAAGGVGNGASTSGLINARQARVIWDENSQVMFASSALYAPRTIVAGAGYSKSITNPLVFGGGRFVPVSRMQNVCLDGAMVTNLTTFNSTDWHLLNCSSYGLNYTASNATADTANSATGNLVITPAQGETKTLILPVNASVGGFPYLDLIAAASVSDQSSFMRLSINYSGNIINGFPNTSSLYISDVPQHGSSSVAGNTWTGPSQNSSAPTYRTVFPLSAFVPFGTAQITFKMEFYSGNGTDSWVISDIFADVVNGSPHRSSWAPSSAEMGIALVGSSSPGFASTSLLVSNGLLDHNQFLFSFDIAWTAHSGTGNALIVGLPFLLNPGPVAAVDASSEGIGIPGPLRARFTTSNSRTALALFTENLSTGVYNPLPLPSNGMFRVFGRYATL